MWDSYPDGTSIADLRRGGILSDPDEIPDEFFDKFDPEEWTEEEIIEEWKKEREYAAERNFPDYCFY